ncbi:MAG: hypothetical protein E6G32_09010 [Actinobacteria bacterium]|nr:MAG: hypothetical protein E6G32_09010 [Actinomycetota bacterium]
MKRLILGLGLGTAIAYGWRRLMGGEAEPQPSWTGTDNDPEDLGSVDDDLLARTREATEQEQAEAQPEPAERPSERAT